MRFMLFVSAAAFTALAVLSVGSSVSVASAGLDNQPAIADDACSRLLASHLDGAVISSARLQPANDPVPGATFFSMSAGVGPGPAVSGLPAFCRVTGSIHPEPESDIRFEVWLPRDGWDGRFAGGNNGGLGGAINYMDLAAGVRAGQAVAATDTGHVGAFADGAWAKGHPEKVRDYGWRAIHLTTITAKKLISAYYGRAPERSYFIGCSNGGRQALIEASRFPEDYDGVVAGAPAAVLTDAAIAKAQIVQAISAPGGAIRPEQVSLIQNEVLKQCDALDGQTDGLVDDPRQCRFDASKLACGVSASPLCFSQLQLKSLAHIHRGARDGAGRRITFGIPASGAEVGIPLPMFGWESILLGERPPGGGKSLADGILTELAQTPVATTANFDFDRDPARLRAALSSDLDAQPDLGRFFARGGKLIMWHGWADTSLPPEGTIAFYEAILRNSGLSAKNQARLFMVPGVQHCTGGTGADMLGQAGTPLPSDRPEQSLGAALKEWVEAGRPPESIVGRRSGGKLMLAGEAANSARQRLICAYPKRAVLQPGGNPDRAASYACKSTT